MGRVALRTILVAVLVGAVLLACGCERYSPATTEKQAEAYYAKKYHEHAKVAESHGLGNYSLFGYSWGGTEYMMSDGTSIIYCDSTASFSDNRQDVEIQREAKAFLEEKLAQIPGKLTSLEDVAIGTDVGFETYEGEGVCWATRYDGDIEEFLKAEKPYLHLTSHYTGEEYAEGRFGYELAFDAASSASLELRLIELGRYFDLAGVDVAVVDPDALATGDLTLFDDGLHYVIDLRANENGTATALRFKPAFVSLMDGMRISSQEPGVTLHEGDVRFEDVGDGFAICRIQGPAAEHPDIHFYLHNDTDLGITKVSGIDRFATTVEPHQHRAWCMLVDGATYYLGDSADIKPYVEVESVSASHIVVRYHTHFKDQIDRVEFRTIGFAYKDGSGTSETVAFESRILEETTDGWRCEIDIRDDARKDNTFYLQFTYNDDENVSVQIEQKIDLP